MVSSIYNYKAIGKKVNYTNIVEQLYSKIKRKSIIFLIGDFFDTSNLNLNLLSKKHEVIVIIVRDRFEEKPSAFESINFTDPSTFEKFDGSLSSSSVKEYENIISKNDEKLYKNLKSFGVEFIKVYTDENIISKMMKLFK